MPVKKIFNTCIVILILSLGFAGCSRDRQFHPSTGSEPAFAKGVDSLRIIDSLVNALKVPGNIKARFYASRAVSLAQAAHSGDALTRAYVLMGIAYGNKDADSAHLYYTRAMTMAIRFNMYRIMPQIVYNLAMLHYNASNHKMAVIYLDSSIRLARREGDFPILSNAFNSLGNMKLDILDTAAARVMFDSAYQIAARHQLLRQSGIAMASLARFTGNPTISAGMEKQAINLLSKQQGNEEEIALIRINLGLNTPYPDTAIMYFKAAIQIAPLGNYSPIVVSAYNNMAYSYLEKNEVDSAAACLAGHAIPLAEESSDYSWLSTLYDSYKDVLVARGDFRRALEFEQKALQAQIEANRRQATDQVRLLAMLLDVRNKELLLQSSEKKLQEKQYRIRQLILWSSIAGMILLSGILSVLWLMQRNKGIFQARLIIATKKIIEIEENLKGRVAMELHDLVSPFSRTMMRQIEEARISDRAIEDKLKAGVSGMAGSIRAISHRMNNDFIGQLTLRELVEGLCNDLRLATDTSIHCLVDHKPMNFSREDSVHIYRIVQELLTNAVKYASGGEIRISLSLEEEMLIILYQDTGPGFDIDDSKKQGLGLMNIFERVRIINGKSRLISEKGKGTRWNIIIPHKSHT